MKVTVFDAEQEQLDARVLTCTSGAAVIQIDGIEAGADYFIRVNTGTTFNLTVDFTTKATPQAVSATGTVKAGQVQAAQLCVSQSEVMNFVLAGTGSSKATVVMTIYDSTGAVVFVLNAAGGSTQSGSVFLAQGSYRVEVTLAATSRNLGGGALQFSIAGYALTDPIGATPTDPTSTPVGGTGPSQPPPSTDPTATRTATTPSTGSLWF